MLCGLESADFKIAWLAPIEFVLISCMVTIMIIIWEVCSYMQFTLFSEIYIIDNETTSHKAVQLK